LRRPAIAALWCIVAVGVALRLFLVWRWRPAFLGFPDSTMYIRDAHFGIYTTPLRASGYGLFLRLLHAIRPHLSFAIAVQHLLGLWSGLLLFFAVRRTRAAEWAGLVPAAVVILGGSEILLEHAPLTETLFIFLIDLSLYSIVRWVEDGLRWFVAAGLALGIATVVRPVALPVLVAALVIGFFGIGGATRQRLLRLALTGVLAAIPIGWYLHDHQQATGIGGFASASNFDLYGRVAPFADCSKFHPSASLRRLCISVPVSQRPGPNYWEFTGSSPAVQVFGEPDESAPAKNENSQLASFAKEAVLGQPFTYVHYVARDLWRLVNPGASSSPYPAVGNGGYGDGPQQLADYYFNPQFNVIAMQLIAAYYPGDGAVHHSVHTLLSYERITRIDGVIFVLLLLLALPAPFLATGRARYGAVLFLATALLLLVVPPAVAHYEYRFAIPGFGPLAAAAGVGAAEIAQRVQRRRSRGIERDEDSRPSDAPLPA
jgi:hypothetical protein